MLKNAEIHGPIRAAEYRQTQTAPRDSPFYIESQSGLKMMLRDPEGYARGPDPEPPEDDGPGLLYGSVLDKIVLTPSSFEEEYVIAPSHYTKDILRCSLCGSESEALACTCSGSRIPRSPYSTQLPWTGTSKTCKEWEKSRESRGLTVVPNKTWRKVSRAHAILTANPDVKKYLIPEAERQVLVTAEWHDPDTGIVIPLRGLIDFLGGNFMGDLKSSRVVSAHNLKADGWYSMCVKYGYFFQAAFYLDLVLAVGEKIESFLHIVQSSAWPHSVACWQIGREQLEIGRQEYQEALRSRARYLRDKKFPGITEGWPVIPTPEYVLRRQQYENNRS